MQTVDVDEILSRAVLIARLITELGEPDLRRHAADFGRCIIAQQPIPESTRRGFAQALTQPCVVHAYTILDLDTLHHPGLRSLARAQIALSVYMES